MLAAAFRQLRRGDVQPGAVRALDVVAVPDVEPLAAAAVLPLLFIHASLQPALSLRAGGTSVHAYASDLAVLLILVLAVVAGARRGFAPLRAGLPVWIAGGLFLAWVVVEVGLGAVRTPGYPWHTHAVTAAKWIEYALLAPAVPLLVRRRADLLALLWSLVLCAAAAAVAGIAQFGGAAILEHGRRGGRQGSFLGLSDFAALAAAVLVVAAVALAAPRAALGRRFGAVAAAAGAVGVALAAAVASVLGLVTGGILLALRLRRRDRSSRRRTAAITVVVALALAAVLILRGGDIGSFGRFLGTSKQAPAAREHTVQTYAQHTLLVWIGFKIWEDSPLLGSGWESSQDPGTFERHVAAAKRRFPNEPPLAFPAATRPYGVQNIWVQALADLGVIGLALLVGLFVTVAWVAWRHARTAANAPALVGLGVTGLVAWLWAAQGFVAGIPLDAVTWLGFGLVALAPVWQAQRLAGAA